MGIDFWTEGRVDRLRVLFADGLSTGLIANELGVSRNSVCGKLSRIGLFRKAGEKPKYVKAKPSILKPRTHIVAANGNSNGLRITTVHEPVSIAPLRDVEVEPRNLDLLDLAPNDCRYPYGEGSNTVFCGRSKTDGSSYCAAHDHLCRKASF
jgi:GcrA cell cycle regulator